MFDTHDVSDVLDGTYVLVNSEDIVLWAQAEIFFSVLREHLYTGKTKKIICQYQEHMMHKWHINN